MKIGVCGGFDKLEAAKAAGFAYLEPGVSATAALSDEEFQAVLTKSKEVGLPTPVFNLLFPGTIHLLAEECTNEQITAYLEGALSRVEKLGGTVCVFGSGRSRAIPEGMSFAEGFRKLVEVTRLVGQIAAKHGVTIAIEPLCRKESNIINSVAEGACLAAAVNHPNVMVLADYYHMATDNEQLTDIARIGVLKHTHIAAKVGRLYPTEVEEGFCGFMKGLKDIGYTGLMSVEGGTEDMSVDGPKSIALLKSLWQNA